MDDLSLNSFKQVARKEDQIGTQQNEVSASGDNVLHSHYAQHYGDDGERDREAEGDPFWWCESKMHVVPL